ncbi:MAG: hypothetical protein ABSG04_16785 [Verrucomicrobiota bacterium]
MTANAKTGIAVGAVCAAFSALAVAFLSDPGGTHLRRAAIAMVDTNFLDKSTTRRSYADLARAGADLSDFDCYVCHDKKTPPLLRLDANQNILVAAEHIGPTNFAAEDLGTNELAGLIGRWKAHSDPVSAWLWQGLSSPKQLLLMNFKPSEPSSKQVQDMVVTALNKPVAGPCIYEEKRFKGILLGAETIVHLQQSRSGANLAHLNRLLLEDAYPAELARNRHADIVMGHGQHGRNNNCFNCHNETNLTLLQPRDGRQLTFAQSSQLCGSCHGPTKADWDAGAHGRTSGDWNRSPGAKGYSTLSEDEIKDWPSLAKKLSQHSDALSAFLWQRFSNQQQAMLTNNLEPGPGAEQVKVSVVQVLNQIIGEPSLDEGKRFEGILLRPETTDLMKTTATGTALGRLNRLLLEDAYPQELTRNMERKDCVNCHNPHYPHFPSRPPAPGPHPLREAGVAEAAPAHQE